MTSPPTGTTGGTNPSSPTSCRLRGWLAGVSLAVMLAVAMELSGDRAGSRNLELLLLFASGAVFFDVMRFFGVLRSPGLLASARLGLHRRRRRRAAARSRARSIACTGPRPPPGRRTCGRRCSPGSRSCSSCANVVDRAGAATGRCWMLRQPRGAATEGTWPASLRRPAADRHARRGVRPAALRRARAAPDAAGARPRQLVCRRLASTRSAGPYYLPPTSSDAAGGRRLSSARHRCALCRRAPAGRRCGSRWHWSVSTAAALPSWASAGATDQVAGTDVRLAHRAGGDDARRVRRAAVGRRCRACCWR